MLREALVVLGSLVVLGCATPSAATRPPSLDAAGTRRDSPPSGETAAVLRFESLTHVVLDGPSKSELALDFRTPQAAVSLADVAGSHGVVVPLATLVEGAAPRSFTIEATPSCPAPWLIDVAAPWLVVRTTIRAAPASLRAGCGPIAHADFVTGFGPERVVVYGAAAFDPRMVASEMGIIRSDLERMFEVRVAELWINEIAVGPNGSVAGPVAEPSPTGLRMRLDAATAWGAEARLELGTTIARIWLAKLVGQIAPVDPQGAVTPEGAALVHGIGRGIARESLFELGLLSPDEYAADLDRAEALVAERSAAWRPVGSVDARDVAARAALASIDAAALAWRLREADPPLGLPQALAASSDGAEDLAGLWKRLVGGTRPRKLGACILQRSTKARVVDLGVLTPWQPERGAAVVTSIREGGVGAGAGIAEGDEISGVIAVREGSVVTVRRRDAAVALTSTARPEVMVRRGWVRRADLADERCYPQL